MIVTDLDNTLLRRDKTISNHTVDVFRCCRERGMLLAYATARDFRFVTDHIVSLTGFEPDVIIADNGAFAQYRGKDVYKRMIPYKTINTLISRFDLVRCVSTESAYYLSGDYSNDHWSIGKKATVIIDFSNNIEQDAFYIDGDISISPMLLTEGCSDIRAVVYSDVNLVTVVHREATKLNALTAMVNFLNIDKSNIAVFGDDYSDIEILSNYDCSIAVANAIDDCKAAAKYLCGDCDEDGVAKWLEENVL